MLTKVYENPNIFQIEVPLPENPLRNLNCYVIQDSGETLILDTGFHRPECEAALLEGLQALSVDWERTNLFLTHLHSDHTGLAPTIMEGKSGRIFMSETDHRLLCSHMNGTSWEQADDLFYREGFTREQLKELEHSNPARGLKPTTFFEATYVADGDELFVGKWKFVCVSVPGHTPGQMCLYCPEKKLMFTADHVLFDITPNITHWSTVKDSLGAYLESLVKSRGYDVEIALPAHRKGAAEFYGRIQEIIEHHLVRLCETVEALALQPNSNATAIAAQLKWSMRGKTWEAFPLSQRWFAVGETIAHLEYLLERGLAEREETAEGRTYRLCLRAEACKVKLEEIWNTYRE